MSLRLICDQDDIEWVLKQVAREVIKIVKWKQLSITWYVYL